MILLPSLLLIGLPSEAQQVPSSFPLTRPPEALSPKLPVKPQTPILTSPSTSPQDNPSPPSVNEVLIPVKRIDVLGSSILTSVEIETLVSPLQNKSVTLSQLQEVADKITQIYQDRNYITSRAVLTPQDIKDGVVTIQVREGALERVDVKRSGDVIGRLNDSYIRDRILQAASTPLNFTYLEDALQLLRSDPLIGDIRANLTTGSQQNQSILQITFSEAKSLSIRPFFDNYGNTSTGIYRAGVNLQELNTTGIGDSTFVGYTRSGSSDVYQLNYQYPINPKGGTLVFNFSAGQNPITEKPFDSLNILTDSQTYELAYRQPLLRSPREEFALGGSIAFENSGSYFGNRSFNFQNFKFDDGRSQSRVLRFSQDYLNRDPDGAWVLRSTLNLGLNILGATIRNDGSPDGRFFYWIGQVLRVQRLGNDKDTLAFFRFNMQFSGDQLLSLNRFSIGGYQSIRGYRQNQLAGDSGLQASVEFQFPVARDEEGVSIVKLLPFVEAGTIWNSSGVNSTTQSLFGLGLGAIYQPLRNLVLRLDYGIPLVNVSNSGNNLQDSGLYFSVNANF
ncbi:hemolysin activation/secretion protein [Pseudanabaena sp. lw0831]|uniref:ShlB/FhaC/HecB family hemolysin secretion/activation protein n=1 Tax=Pseudanabaena sp. lw0831 TaxID=1357935 RepID=UPI001916884F|nr:ShlB/FhaC/HecB family hemolysin secretion/activation protein [Pseudanabaena sp. lw0831]GBO52302.1 hemolysin activation/secretion protein [Pseudanabaena sp. lw0831]